MLPDAAIVRQALMTPPVAALPEFALGRQAIVAAVPAVTEWRLVGGEPCAMEAAATGHPEDIRSLGVTLRPCLWPEGRPMPAPVP